MRGLLHRAGIVIVSGLASLTVWAVVSPAVSAAADCGPGTFFDAATNTCLVAGPPAPLPPPPPPPAVGDITPGFGVGVCIPIPVPFAPSVCGGI
ncbi:hypothetical protein JRC04_05590 [Mycolicibacterium sp. S2-37]|uniref:hypothetical protein n=1 Tax=Mycolicibacterium sp. S2-37 TaxID=2810297 RepID=UPI001A93BA68|nr:hypothetical protein [Mycolicibacterium sp. S2-37]MBO0676929.1 hypothetical protein [Mycolicibacterium sp. S2-37]